MSRGLSPEAVAALSSGSPRVEHYLDLVFSGSTLYLWTGFGDSVYDGNAYLGNGWIEGISSLSETLRLSPTGMTISLSGVPADLLSIVLSESRQSCSATLYFAVFDEDDTRLDVLQLFTGSLDTVSIDEQPETASIVLDYESRLIKLNAPREARYTPEQQKMEYPADKGFDYLTFLESSRLYWGRPDLTRGQK
jgi:hypothetical protein